LLERNPELEPGKFFDFGFGELGDAGLFGWFFFVVTDHLNRKKKGSF
jgi:hypothetical protein